MIGIYWKSQSELIVIEKLLKHDNCGFFIRKPLPYSICLTMSMSDLDMLELELEHFYSRDSRN